MSSAHFQTGIFNLVNECTMFTRITTLLLIVFYGLSFITSSFLYLSIIPAYFLPPKCWIFSLFTFSFFENRFVFIIVDILTIYFTEKLLLPVWGWLELLKFCALTNWISAVLTVFTFVFLYALTYKELYLFHTYIYGMAPLISALAVANRQQMGDNVIVNFKFGKFRNKHISIGVLIFVIMLTCINVISISFCLMYCYGFLVSWIYLRFYQRHKNGNIGDLSDKFSFAGFFPYYIEGPISIITNSIFAALIYLHICKKIDRHYDISSPTTISISVSSGDIRESERRKQMALKALNERLSQNTKPTNWPSLIDDGTPTTTNVVSDNHEQTYNMPDVNNEIGIHNLNQPNIDTTLPRPNLIQFTEAENSIQQSTNNTSMINSVENMKDDI